MAQYVAWATGEFTSLLSPHTKDQEWDAHAGFASLLALKLVSRCFSTAARATLLSSSRWATARHLCAGQSLRDAMSDYASTLTPCKDNRLATAFLAALRADDVRTIEVLLHQGLFSTRVPVSSRRSCNTRTPKRPRPGGVITSRSSATLRAWTSSWPSTGASLLEWRRRRATRRTRGIGKLGPRATSRAS